MVVRRAALESDGLMLSGWLYLPSEEKGRTWPVVCICHGIPSEPAVSPEESGYAAFAEWMSECGYAAFVFTFRGIGESEGNLDIGSWARDLSTVVDHLDRCPELDSEKIVLVGISAGGMVSLYAAAHDRRVDSVIACSSPADFGFTSPEKAIRHFRSIGVIRDADFPESPDEWDKRARLVSPLYYIYDIAPRPVVLIHGDQDEVVNVRESYRLYEVAREPKDIHIIEGLGHHVMDDPRVRIIIKDFLESRLSGK